MSYIIFTQYFSPFLCLPLSHFATSIPHVLNCLSLLITHSAPSFLSFRLIPVSFSLLFLSFALSLPRYSGISPLSYTSHTPSCIWIFFYSLASFLLICVFVPFTQLHIHPSSFCSQSFHFFTGISIPLEIFLSLLLHVLFFSLQHSINIRHSSLQSILSSNFATLFPAFTLSLFLLHFSLTM
jgi:hypothetical protein